MKGKKQKHTGLICSFVCKREKSCERDQPTTNTSPTSIRWRAHHHVEEATTAHPMRCQIYIFHHQMILHTLSEKVRMEETCRHVSETRYYLFQEKNMKIRIYFDFSVTESTSVILSLTRRYKTKNSLAWDATVFVSLNGITVILFIYKPKYPKYICPVSTILSDTKAKS